MERPITSKCRIGEWNIDPDSGRMVRNGESVRLELRSMLLLMCLAERAGQVVSIDELIGKVWAGVAVSPDSVYQAITALRRQLGDDPRKPVYIETVPRLGYRLIANVGPWAEEPPGNETDQPMREPSVSSAGPEVRHPWLAGKAFWIGLCVVILVGIGYLLHPSFSIGSRSAAAVAPPNKSVGVMPILDLTEGMRNEEFADGITEEIIDKLSKVPGVQVPSATASLYYKGKELPVAEIAREMKVSYLLDGSVRKSNGRIRIAVRLVRAENSYVIWSNTYDRPLSDLITVQDEIAAEVVKSLQSKVGST